MSHRVNKRFAGDGNQALLWNKIMSRFRFVLQSSAIVAFAAALVLGVVISASGQSSWPFDQKKTALDVPDSRAEREAEQMVALSADKIISLLREEDGLMLQVKKALVRKAYEQGRLLDPEELTDDAVFNLLREDHNIRVIATREIEDRYYVKAKPSRNELYRNCLLYAQTQQSPNFSRTSTGAQKPQPKTQPNDPTSNQQQLSQEQLYWVNHEDELFLNCPEQMYYNPQQQAPTMSAGATPQSTQLPSSQFPGLQLPGGSQPSLSPFSNPQLNNPWQDPRRQLQMTQWQTGAGAGDYFAGSEGNPLSHIRPEELPSLLSTSGTGSSFGNSSSFGMSAAQGLSGAGMVPAAITSGTSGSSSLSSLFSGMSANGLPTSPVFPNQDPTASFPQVATLDSRYQTQFPQLATPENPVHPMLRHRANPYADVPSLYDMYAQYSSHSPILDRFGADIFTNGTGNFEELPMDLPAGPEYVVGPGDGLKIELWGGYSDSLVRVVDRDGRVSLPEAGSVQVSGKNLGDVQHLVQSALRTQFRDIEADVSLARVRTVRVYVVGDVQRGGAYDMSSLSTPLNALYLAGGPTSRGSLRIVKHYRGKQLLETVDLYDMLLHGVSADLQHLQAGDTIMVPPMGPVVTVEGMVRRPAIYELNGEKSLAEVLELAGGVLPSGTLRHVDVERIESHQSRTMLRLDIPETNNEASVNKSLDEFGIKDGDDVKISPIIPYADKTVYLDGHVFRPGKYAYRDGMKISDLIKSYHDLLPEPAKQHAEIIRLQQPDLTPTVLTFNLADALAGKEQDVELKPFDTVRIFSRFDFEDPPLVTVSGEIRDPGDHVTNGATYLRDAIYLAGGTTPDALLDDAQVFRKTPEGGLKVLSVNLAKALEGDAKNNILLAPKDRIFVHRDQAKMDPPTVKIEGEVGKPGKYPLGEDMTAADLVRLAGGLKRGAYTESADLTRYTVENGQKVIGEHQPVEIAKALAGEEDSNVRLHDGDVLTIRQLAGWNDVGATIKVDGEVIHPGTYGIHEGERLSSIIARAGGFRTDAYPYGALFLRTQVKELEDKNRAELIRLTQDQGPALKAVLTPTPDDKLAQEAALQQWQVTLENLQDTPPAGRLVIRISSDVKRWANSSADIQVRAGDSIYIPKKPTSVLVDGSVYNPTAVSFKPGKSAGWYLRQAGGPTNMANTRATFVIRADGSVVGGKGGLFTGGVESAALQPGDMVLVPEKGFTTNTRWKSILQAAQIAYFVGISAQVARNF